MQVVLVMLRSDGERRSFSIVRDITMIGRREDCDFRIPLGDISRKHCRLMKEDGVLKVQDLGSSNGTFVNNQRIQESELAPGDSLQLGGVSFIIQIDGVPADHEILHPQLAAEEAPTLHATEEDVPETVPEMPAEESASGNTNIDEFDPLSALGDSNADSNLPSDSQISRDLLDELGGEATKEHQA